MSTLAKLDNTDDQLAQLAAIFEDRPVDYLCDVLLNQAGGSLAKAVELISDPKRLGVQAATSLRQTSIARYCPPLAIAANPTPFKPALPGPLKPAHPSRSERENRPYPLAPTRVPVQPLFHPDDIAARLPCRLIHGFLPTSLADQLLRYLLNEAPSWPRRTWYLAERLVSSSCRTVLYMAPQDANTKPLQGPADSKPPTNSKNDWKSATAHGAIGYYHDDGSPAQCLPFNDLMDRARRLVEAKVNELLATHNGPAGQASGLWKANAIVGNSYQGSAQGLGWHNDKLTRIGPAPTIASLSLGVTRQFRIRRIPTTYASGIREPTYDVDLPHNTLLVMMPPMQEQYQHSIARFTPIDRHPVSDDMRINLTFRYYRPEYAAEHTPRCRCGVPCELNVVTRTQETLGRYYYICTADAAHGGPKCGFFQWLEQDKVSLTALPTPPRPANQTP
ncbi:hypothetical protein H4R35_001830 [Dimargaris xerosporica]|nr:hypothetical protein H4R35_001830 [Dimargaris xerosporica]